MFIFYFKKFKNSKWLWKSDYNIIYLFLNEIDKLSKNLIIIKFINNFIK